MMAVPLPADWASPPNSNTRRSTAAFTLIELLVVVSIIAVLISILLPALARARESARTLQCATQLRQVQMGLLNYAYESRGKLPYAHTANSAGTADDEYWSGFLVKGRHVPLVELFWCPSHDATWGPYGSPIASAFPTMRTTFTGSIWAYTGYSVNRYGAMPTEGESSPTRQPVNIDRVDVPASDLLILTEGYSRNQPSAGSQTPTRGGWYWVWPNTSSSSLFTHQGDANISFLDGHVETRKSEALGWSYADQAWIVGYNKVASPWYQSIYTKSH